VPKLTYAAFIVIESPLSGNRSAGRGSGVDMPPTPLARWLTEVVGAPEDLSQNTWNRMNGHATLRGRRPTIGRRTINDSEAL
jgi:hypothetical protein